MVSNRPSVFDDQDNRLIYSKVNDIETYYEIGAENLRKKKTTATTTTEYVTDKNGLVICENSDEIINGMTPLAVKRDGSYYYYICNGHGDVVMLLDEQGNVKNSYSYDPWGKITSESETVSNSIKYAGEYYDAENGLIYLRNRYYDPSIGRFTSEDPIEDGLNWYVYCENNPVMFVDPTGDIAIQLKAGLGKLLVDTAYLAFTDALKGEFSTWGEYVGTAIGGFVEGTLLTTPGAQEFASITGSIVYAVIKNSVNQTFTGEEVFIDIVIESMKNFAGDTVSSCFGNEAISRQIVRNALRKSGKEYTGEALANAIKDAKNKNEFLKESISKITQSIVDEITSLQSSVNKNNYNGVDSLGIIYTAYYEVDGKIVEYYDPNGIANEWLCDAIWWEVGK